MARKALGLVCAISISLLACGAEGPGGGSGRGDGPEFAGMYEVEGSTVEKATGSERSIQGTVILTKDPAGEYTWTFEMQTTFPTPDGPAETDVIGKGEGTVQEGILRGKAQTQLVIGGVPGVDPAFAFIPRVTTTRIVSNAVGEFDANGILVVEIESEPEEGEEYAATRTILRGRRMAANELPSVSEAAGEE